jgi:hypothetical protein
VGQGHWHVEFAEAFRSWVGRRRPSLDEEIAVFFFLVDCERSGPPVDVVADDRGNLTATTGQGRTVQFRRYDNPGAGATGYMLVLRIS